jgi:anti-sigma factor RsiW
VRPLADDAAASVMDYVQPGRTTGGTGLVGREALALAVTEHFGQLIALPDLAGAGYRLIGGRVVVSAHGPAALFVYEDAAGVRLAIFARPTDMPDTRRVAEIDVGAMDGCVWVDRGIGYAMTGDKPYSDLLRLSREARQQTRLLG